jgi:anti-sigma regulatory factor (Ser/Thr protein kinase)
MTAPAARVLPAPLTVPVACEADVVLCQQKARAFAAALGFDSRAQWEVAIAVSEAVTNIFKYVGRGWLHLRPVAGDPAGLEFEAIDQGAGIGDVGCAMRDGISEGRDAVAEGAVPVRRGLGLGLGTIRRLMDSLEIESGAQGTRLRARRWPAARRDLAPLDA